MPRSGTADLPLHYGRVPPWLADRMARMGRAITEAIIEEYGLSEWLYRISDPLWFQSLGAVMGMDWHSSGITTSVVGALKRGLQPIAKDLGLYICGGRGKHSRNTPAELMVVGEKTGLDGKKLVRFSRLSAKVDNTAVQDGFQIYLHSFFVSRDGEWAVVQQGMNGQSGYARRYHWHSSEMESFLCQPHTGVCGQNQGLILNLTDPDAAATQQAMLQITGQHPEKLSREIRKIYLPSHHDVFAKDVDLKRLGTVLAVAYEEPLRDFESLLLLKGMGPRTVQSLALVSEVIHGTPTRFQDPARFSFAHGGKDGKPFPVPTKVYDESIHFLKDAVEKARLGHSDKKKALHSLHETCLRLEKGFTPNERFDEWVEKEWKESHQHGGRWVGDGLPSGRKRKKPNNQLKLF